ncbi:hypothetical protein [Paenibacillus sp. YN15]|uniref:hypothetical protein n=1 Tax=Paenibacillus sp. YN15 TaxID=1742774 RepID=UPI000DCDC64D|nr:hypothetical protein [Paenibacillus sp. YN15]RAU95532.1 hypothetical protein DQG13_21935 [Paenibacillus sp. YN15]
MSVYSSKTVTVNGKSITLHVISAPAANVTLKTINSKVPDQSNYWGINGSFYAGNGDLLSISVVNDYPLKPSFSYGGRYNVGDNSNSLDKGNIVFDGAENNVNHQITDRYTDITVVKRGNYWAQGGISMSLNNDANWQAIMQAQQLPSPDWSTQRTALAYTNHPSPVVYGIVATTGCLPGEFRAAIKAGYSFEDAIFLDSGPSSQMRAKDANGNIIAITGGNTPQEMIVFY